MSGDIEKHMAKFDTQTQQRFRILYELVLASTDREVKEKLWAKIPSVYCGENFVRLIPFKDHINIEAAAVSAYRDQLTGYKMTPKGMLQIFHTQDIPEEVLTRIFKESLETGQP